MITMRRRLGFDEPFRWRGTEMSRMEAFSDAVFAFALTLIVVTLEPPTEFADLMAALAKFPGFALAFVLLMMLWVQHTLFCRRYGLEDLRTLVVNSLLMFVVLFYVYPMRFLVGILADVTMGNRGWNSLELGEWRQLMIIYAIGFAAVSGLFWLLFRHALANADALELDAIERHKTRTSITENLINVGAAVVSIAAVLLIPEPFNIPVAGWTYGLLWPVHYWHGARAARLCPPPDQAPRGSD